MENQINVVKEIEKNNEQVGAIFINAIKELNYFFILYKEVSFSPATATLTFLIVIVIFKNQHKFTKRNKFWK